MKEKFEEIGKIENTEKPFEENETGPIIEEKENPEENEFQA